MSRLNGTIKLLFCIGELFLLLISVLFVVISALVLLGRVNALTYSGALEMAMYCFVLSTAVLLCTCVGCYGAVRQTTRKGCSGRRILALHQLLLLVVLLFSYSQVCSIKTVFEKTFSLKKHFADIDSRLCVQHDWLEERETSMQLVIQNRTSYEEYDRFEKRLDQYFNSEQLDPIFPYCL
jgi:hypothetical protein